MSCLLMPAELEKRIGATARLFPENVIYFTQHLGRVESRWKEDASRVTDADLALSRSFLGRLAAMFPEDDLVSEEDLPTAAQGARALRQRFCWVLDPIDGTNNYALGLPLCGMLLALLEDGEPVYGWIYDHLGKRLVEGGPERGIRVDGIPCKPAAASADFSSNELVSLHLPIREEYSLQLSPLLQRNTGRCLGSSALHLAYNALGHFSGSFSHSTKVWDLAAGHAVLAAVGRRMIFLGPGPFPLRSLPPRPPNLPNIAGTEAFLRFTLPLLLSGKD